MKHCDGDMGKCRTFHKPFPLFLAVELLLHPPFSIFLTITSTPQQFNAEMKSTSQSSIWCDTGFAEDNSVWIIKFPS